MAEAQHPTMASADPLLGAQLGGYVIEGLLGKGAMGAVYRARQLSVNRPVALKVMMSHLAEQEDMVARFRREARAAAAVSHPHLIQIYSFGEEEGTCFFAMELVEGQSLGDILKRGERFSEAECLEIGRQTLAALHVAHRAGIVHRDIKPANLMLDTQGQIKVADLGLARFSEPDSDVSLTLTGMSMGTPLYMAPEQALGEKTLDHRADFYSLGATLFHLATGRRPYEGSAPAEVLSKHLTAPVPRARSVNPELSQPFSDLIACLMAKKPGERPQNHAEIEKALDRCGALLAEEAKDASRIAASAALKVVKRTWVDEPVLWIGGAVAAGVLILAGALYVMFSREPQAADVLGTQATDAVALQSKAMAVGQAPRLPAAAEPAAGPFAAAALTTATKDNPFVNSLGMKFVPIPGTQVLFSVWETRVKDFDAFVKDGGYSWSQKAGFEQTPEDPVVYVSWDDANAFCAWLSKKEGQEYRLPTDEEWDAAVGKKKYPWGGEYPPPENAENLAGAESKVGDSLDPPAVLAGYKDDHPRTAPVGSYKASKAGLYDMGGNVREWVKDWYTEALYKKYKDGGGYELKPEQLADIEKGDTCRVLRGGFLNLSSSVALVSSGRNPAQPGVRRNFSGFRCVLVASSP